MSRVIHSEIDPALCTVPAENRFQPTLLSAATSPISPPPHPRAKGTTAPYPHLLSQDLSQCWHLAVEERNLDLRVYTPRLRLSRRVTDNLPFHQLPARLLFPPILIFAITRFLASHRRGYMLGLSLQQPLAHSPPTGLIKDVSSGAVL